MKKFTDKIAIHLADTDATGVIFFPKLFEKCLIILENFLRQKGMHNALITDHINFPVINAHGSYFAPIKVYDELVVELQVSRIGDTSVSFNYKFINNQGLLAMEAAIVHVCIDAAKRTKKILPDHFIELFSSIYQK
jgi:YbgC/YbaW family acyl-CoA thioester hydrolase